MPRSRDYRREYARRLARGLAAGKSRSAARGHPRAVDLPKPDTLVLDRHSPLEKALARMRRGTSQVQAALAEGVSVEALRRHRLMNTASQLEGRRWIIFDSRPQKFWVVTDGKMVSLTLPNDEGSQVSSHWRGIDAFLGSNDDEHLHPFEGDGVYDVRDRFHQFETRPNVLRKLEAVGDLNFIEIYADVQ